MQYVQVMKRQGKRVNYVKILERAHQMKNELKITNFQPTTMYVHEFCRRNKLFLKTEEPECKRETPEASSKSDDKPNTETEMETGEKSLEQIEPECKVNFLTSLQKRFMKFFNLFKF